MTVREAFRDGRTRGFRNLRVILILYFGNLIFALVAAFPLRSILRNSIGHSTVAEDLTSHFNLEFLIDFLHANAHTLNVYLVSVGFVLIPFFFTTIFLLGGMLSTIQEKETPFSFVAFFSGCARYFFRFIKLILYAIPFLIGIFFLGKLIDRLLLMLFEDSTFESLWFWLTRLKQLALLAAVLFIGLILDYAKIKTVLEDRISTLRTVFLSSRFVFQNLGATIKLSSLIFLWQAIIFVVFSWAFYKVSPGLSIVLMIILQQFFILVRNWFRVAFFGSEIALYRSLATNETVSATRQEWDRLQTQSTPQAPLPRTNDE